MKKALLAMVLLAGSALAGPRFSVGIGFGGPVVVRPVCPGPGYVWVAGYYGPAGIWVPGFWRAPAYPVFEGPHYYAYNHYRPDFHYNHYRDFRR